MRVDPRRRAGGDRREHHRPRGTWADQDRRPAPWRRLRALRPALGPGLPVDARRSRQRPLRPPAFGRRTPVSGEVQTMITGVAAATITVSYTGRRLNHQ